MNLGKLILRLVVGSLFMGHGLQKLRGSFGGPGLDGATQMMGALGMHPPRRNAVAASWTETAGGAAIALGVGTPFAAAGLIATMLTAVRKVHLANGVWGTNGGYEYNAVLMAVVAALADDGPGTVSFDALIGRSRWGLGWGLFAIAAGIAGSTGAIELGKRSAPPVSTDDVDAGATPESTDPAI